MGFLFSFPPKCIKSKISHQIYCKCQGTTWKAGEGEVWKWAWKCWRRDQGQCKFRGWWSRLESSNHALYSVYVSFSSVFNVSLLGNQKLYSHSLKTCILHASIHAVPLYAGSQTVSHTVLHKVKDRHSHTYIPYTSTLTYTLCYINGHCVTRSSPF